MTTSKKKQLWNQLQSVYGTEVIWNNLLLWSQSENGSALPLRVCWCVCVQRPSGIRFIRLHIPWPILSREAELQKIKVAVKKVRGFILGKWQFHSMCVTFLFYSGGKKLDSESMTHTRKSQWDKTLFPRCRTVSCGSGRASLGYGIPSSPKSTPRFSQTSLTLTPTKIQRPAFISKPSNTHLLEISCICECPLSLSLAHTQGVTPVICWKKLEGWNSSNP